MADAYVKIIPINPYACVSESVMGEILNCLKSCVKADSIAVHVYENPVFVDCGSNLEEIRCPSCGECVSFEWWVEAMEQAGAQHFAELNVEIPCCGSVISLNELMYHFPCGFACVEFDILNPIEELDMESIKRIEKLLDVPIRVIHAHL